MECRNNLLDDLCAEIGYTATTVLCAVYGGTHLYVAKDAAPDSTIVKLIGQPAYRALARSDFGGTTIFIPRNAMFIRYSRWRKIKDMLQKGESTKKICEAHDISHTQVHKIRRALEEVGLLPMILHTTPEEQDADGPRNAD